MRWIAVFTALMLTLLPLTSQAEEPGDSIQAVIADQISAFQTNDVERAFTHAAPNIQRIFGTPERFGEMVQQGYPMVWRPARYEWLQIVQTDFGPVQVVLFEDLSGRLHEAGYLMEQVDGIWRINGVKLRARAGVGA